MLTFTANRARNLREHFVLGCSAFAGIYSPVTEEASINTILRAVDAGVRMMDTAPHYGCGMSEERVSQALGKIEDPDITKDIQVWTKVGRVMLSERDTKLALDDSNVPGTEQCLYTLSPMERIPHYDFSFAGAMKSHEDSRKRMPHVAKFYGLRVHDCEDKEKMETTLDPTNGSLAALVQLRKDGITSDVGLGVNSPDYALNIIKSSPEGTINTILLAGAWNLMEQLEVCLELFEECMQRGIKIHIAGVLASGLLAGRDRYRYAEPQSAHLDKRDQWLALCAEYDLSLPAVAVAFCLMPSAVSAVAIGVRSEEEFAQAVEWFNTDVPVELYAKAKQRGLLAEHVPLPV
jgi:D-threo-aldose 1-dehydrogenase